MRMRMRRMGRLRLRLAARRGQAPSDANPRRDANAPICANQSFFFIAFNAFIAFIVFVFFVAFIAFVAFFTSSLFIFSAQRLLFFGSFLTRCHDVIGLGSGT